jgi:hypothetical protein
MTSMMRWVSNSVRTAGREYNTTPDKSLEAVGRATLSGAADGISVCLSAVTGVTVGLPGPCHGPLFNPLMFIERPCCGLFDSHRQPWAFLDGLRAIEIVLPDS